jgi:hypothetical protein
MRSPSPTRSTPPSEPGHSGGPRRAEDDPSTDPPPQIGPDVTRAVPGERSGAAADRSRKSGNTENQDPTRPPP